MKKIKTVCASLLLVSVLAGCQDATAKLPDSSTVLFSVGSKNVTKGDVYSVMAVTNGASQAVNDVNRIIAQNEIELTEEMKTQAQQSLESYKTYYGDTFTKHLEQIGMTEQEYLDNYLIPSLQAEQLTPKYITDNFDKVAAAYAPVKATLLEFTSQDDANAALSELKDGSKDAATAAKDHNSASKGTSEIYTIESTDLDSTVRTMLHSAVPDDGWFLVPETDGATFVVMRIDNNDPNAFKDEAISVLRNVTAINNDATTYWFRKYNFHIYDKTLYDSVASDYPNNFVQELPAEEETPAVTETEAPETTETTETTEESGN